MKLTNPKATIKTIIPSPYTEENVYMYCNYARNNRFNEPCRDCKEECKHKGKKTSWYQ